MKKVLVVDDDQNFYEVLEEFFGEMEGFDVLKATGGREALDILQEHQVELVVTDIVMPGMDGVDLIGQIIATYPGAKILACSGGGTHGFAKDTVTSVALEQALERGALCSLAKPFSGEEFKEKVREILEEGE